MSRPIWRPWRLPGLCLVIAASLPINCAHAQAPAARRPSSPEKAVSDDRVVQILAAPRREGFDEIIVELPPLKPIKKDTAEVGGRPQEKETATPRKQAGGNADTKPRFGGPSLEDRVTSAVERAESKVKSAADPIRAEVKDAAGVKESHETVSPGGTANPTKDAAAPIVPASVAAPADAPAPVRDVARQPVEAASKEAVVKPEEAPKAAEAAHPANRAAAQDKAAAPVAAAGQANDAALALRSKESAETPSAPADKAQASGSEPEARAKNEAEVESASRIAGPGAEKKAPAEKPPVATGEDVPASGPAPAAASDPAEAAGLGAIIATGVKGPAEIRLADRATLWLPAGRVFLPAEPARKLVEMQGRHWAASTQGVVVPQSGAPEWLAYVNLLDQGLIKDDAGKSLDPEKMLQAFKAAFVAENGDRAAQGRPAIEVTDWVQPPRYDAKTHHLSGCFGAVPGDLALRIIDCASFALGRSGALGIVLATPESGFEKVVGEAERLAGAIVYDKAAAYDDGRNAAEKFAPYGLSEAFVNSVSGMRLSGVIKEGAPQDGGLDVILSVIVDQSEWLLVLVLTILAYAYISVSRRRKKGAAEADDEGLERRRSQPRGAASAAAEKRRPQGLAEAAAPPAQAAGAVARKGRFGSLLGSLPFVSKARKAWAEKPSDAAAASVSSAAGAALSGLAARMRRAQEPEAPPPSLSRAVRSRPSGAAAVAIEMPGPVAAPAGSEASQGDFDLVEPGMRAQPVTPAADRATMAPATPSAPSARALGDEEAEFS